MKRSTYDAVRKSELPIYFEKNERFDYKDSDGFQLLFLEEGTLIISLNQNKMILLGPSIICLNEKDEFEVLEAQIVKARGVYFDPIIVNSLLSIENLRQESLEKSDSEYRDYFLMLPFLERDEEVSATMQLDLPSAKRIISFMDELENELESLSNSFWRCRTRSIFLEVLFFLQYFWTSKTKDCFYEVHQTSELAKKVLLYLHTNYRSKMTLKTLTDEFHVNRTTLSESFQEAIQMSVMDYLIKLRIYMAATLIKGTALPISEIMHRTGFNDSTHFGRTFKKHTGYSPTAFRADLS